MTFDPNPLVNHLINLVQTVVWTQTMKAHPGYSIWLQYSDMSIHQNKTLHDKGQMNLKCACSHYSDTHPLSLL